MHAALRYAVHALVAVNLCAALYWVFGRLGGLGASGDRLFNWHVLLEVSAVAGCAAPGVLAFRVLAASKALHACVAGGGAAVLASAGAVCVFLFHAERGFPDLRSVHSWLGVLALAALWAQLAFGALAFWLKLGRRALVRPLHRRAGVGVFALAVATALSGLTEKQQFVGTSSAAGAFAPVLAVLLVLLAAVVGALLAAGPAPSEARGGGNKGTVATNTTLHGGGSGGGGDGAYRQIEARETEAPVGR